MHIPSESNFNTVYLSFTDSLVIIFSRNLGISIRWFGFPRSTIDDSSRVRGERAYIYMCILFETRGWAAWRRPICDAGNSTPPSRYLPASVGRFLYVWTYTWLHAYNSALVVRRCTCRHRQNLSAMHDRSVAYKPRRAARHYAGRKQKDDSLAAGQSPFAC